MFVFKENKLLLNDLKDLSHTTTTERPCSTTLVQPTLLDDLNLVLNPQPGFPSSAGWDRLRLGLLTLNAGFGPVEATLLGLSSVAP